MYDVTMTINKEMQVYKNRESKKPVFTVAGAKKHGDSTNETDVKFNVHTGTHVDFPRHVYDDGATSKAFDITTFMRPVKVFDLTDVSDGISVSDLEKLTINAGDFILFKTTNSFSEDFLFDFVYLKADGARYLAHKKISGVGIDALGIERDQAGHPTHRALIDEHIWIIEGLRLKDVPSGDYDMIALPLKLDDVDALPLTVLLKRTTL